jgi:hypothetical protein
MTLYRLLLLSKFVGIMLYAGGLVGSFTSSALAERRRAVHAIASPGLLLIWTAGYLLSLHIHVPLTELWIVCALILSFASQLALVRAVSHNRRSTGALLASTLPILVVLALMVFRPTWQEVLP